MTRSLFILLLAALCACGGSTVPMAATPSPYFEAVGSKLELGGEVFIYADIDGEAEAAADFILGALRDSPELGDLADASRLHGASLARVLGLDQAKGIGLSSVENGERYVNRGFVYAPVREGLLRVWGEEPSAFDVLEMAPSDADLVWEQRLDAEALLELVRNLGQLGIGMKPDELETSLDAPLSNLDVTARDLLEDLKTTAKMVLSVDESRNVWLPGQSFTFPHTDFVVAIDGISALTEAFVRYASGDPFVRAERSESWIIVTASIRLPPPWNAYEPALMMERETGRTYLVSSPAFLKRCLAAAGGLTQSDAFTRATASLPTTGNGFLYLSPRITRVMHAALDKVVAAQGPAIQTHVARALLPAAGESYAWVLRNEPDGVLFRSNSASSHKSTLLTFGMAALVPAAMLLAPDESPTAKNPL